MNIPSTQTISPVSSPDLAGLYYGIGFTCVAGYVLDIAIAAMP